MPNHANSKLKYLKGESSISVDRIHINENFKLLDNGIFNIGDRLRVVENESGVKDNLFTSNLEMDKSVFHNLSIYNISFGNGLQIGQNFVRSSAVPTEGEDLINLSSLNLLLADKQDNLVSGTNLKTINNESILGSGNFELPAPTFANLTGDVFDNSLLENLFNSKQDNLVSGTDIKTINGESILGSGNFELPPPNWENISGDISDNTDLQNALNAKEPTITIGTSAQYYRGDKTFQTLDKTAVGLENVDNTSDANKPVSTEQQTEIDTKNIFAYDDVSASPLPRRTEYRAEEFIEFEDDAINEETIVKIRPTLLAQFNSPDIADINGEFRILQTTGTIPFGNTEGLKEDKTLDEIFSGATDEMSTSIFHIVNNKVELLVQEGEIVLGDVLNRGRSSTISAALGSLSNEVGDIFIVGIDGKVQLSGTPTYVMRFNANGEGEAQKLINGNNKVLVSNNIGVEEEVDLVSFLDLLTAIDVTADGVLSTTDLGGIARGILGSWKITDGVIKNTTANEVTIDLGSTPGGIDIASALVVPANGFITIPLNVTLFSETVEQSIYASSSNWNSANLIIKFSVKKVF